MAPTPTFASLRMSPEEFLAYKKETKTPLQRSQPTTRTLRVVGYDDGANAAIAASNGNGKEFIEVPWNTSDSVLRIMERVEEQLRIPLSTWRLAGGGQVFQPGSLARSNSNFQKDSIELFLVPVNVIKSYLTTNVKKNVWKKLSPGTTDSDVPIQKAEVTYHLIRPHPSPHWQDYLTLRQLTDRSFDATIDGCSAEDLDPLLFQVRNGVEATLGRTGFEEEQAKVIFDCLVPLQNDIEPDMDGNVIDGMVNTRIFSPHKASAVDIYWKYHHRYRYESIGFTCKLLFRVLEDTELGSASSRDIPRVEPTVGRHGWTLLFEMGFADIPYGKRWHAIDELEWGLRTIDATWIHDALFGDGSQSPGNLINKVDTICLLFAAVGVPFEASRVEDKEDQLISNCIDGIYWKIYNYEWIGLNIRKACKCPLARDAEWKPREISDSEGEDDYDDDDDDDDEDDMDEDEDEDDMDEDENEDDMDGDVDIS